MGEGDSAPLRRSSASSRQQLGRAGRLLVLHCKRGQTEFTGLGSRGETGPREKEVRGVRYKQAGFSGAQLRERQPDPRVAAIADRA